MGVQILSNLNLDAATRQRLQALPGVNVKILPQHTAVGRCRRMAAGKQVWCQVSSAGPRRHDRIAVHPASSVGSISADRGLGTGLFAFAMPAAFLTRPSPSGTCHDGQPGARCARHDSPPGATRPGTAMPFSAGNPRPGPRLLGYAASVAKPPLARAFGMTVHVLTRNGVSPRRTPSSSRHGDPEGVLPDRVFVAGQEQEFSAVWISSSWRCRRPTKHRHGGERELRALPRTAFVLTWLGTIIQNRLTARP